MAAIPFGYITLLDAFAKAGPQVLPGWTDDTLNPLLWVQSDTQGIAHRRWFEVTGWLEHEINSGALALYRLNAGGEAEVIREYIGARDGASFFLTGRLTNMTRQQALEWLATDRESNDPLLLLDEGQLQAAIDADLRPDETEYWSFAGLLAWICWRRYDKYREYAHSLSGFVFEELRTYFADGAGIVMSGPDGLRDLWAKLASGKLKALGLPSQGNAARTEIPAHEFQDYMLGDEGMMDALLFARPKSRVNVAAYHSPTVRRIDAVAIWTPRNETISGADIQITGGSGKGAAYAPDPANFHPEARANWNIPMAVLWIAHLSYRRVVEGMLEWSDSAVFIRDLETNLLHGPDELGQLSLVKGYSREPLWRPRLTRLLFDRPERELYRRAFDELKERLADKKIETIAIVNGASAQIPPRKWLHLDPVYEPDQVEYFGVADTASTERFYDVYVAREDIEAEWPGTTPVLQSDGDQVGKRDPAPGEPKCDFLAFKETLGREPSRDEVTEWRRNLPYYLSYKDALGIRLDHQEETLSPGRPKNPGK